MTERTKLSGGPDRTVTWIWLEDGRPKIEFYEFSELAERMFGNDIASIVTVATSTSNAGWKKTELVFAGKWSPGLDARQRRGT